MAPLDLISCLATDELTRRADRMMERRRKHAKFRDPLKTFDNFDFNFNKKMNRRLVFELATGAFIARHEGALFLGPPHSGKSHLAQTIGQAVIQQGYRVFYRETHALLEEIADATLGGNGKECLESLVTVPRLIIGDFGKRKLPMTAAEERLELIMRRYERGSTLVNSNRLVDDWGKLLEECGGSQCHARSPASPWTSAEVRPAKLAHENRLARRGAGRVKQLSPRRPPIGRFSPAHLWPDLK